MTIRQLNRCALGQAVMLAAIFVFNSNYFLLFTFVHCDPHQQHQLRLSPNNVAIRDGHALLSPAPHSHLASNHLALRERPPYQVQPSKVGHQSVSPEGVDIKLTEARVHPVLLPTTKSTNNQTGQERQMSGGAPLYTSARFPRSKRMVTPRIKLARRPPKSSTTTTSTSTTTTLASVSEANSDAEDKNEAQAENDEDEEESASELGNDYVEIKQSKPAAGTTTARTTTEAEGNEAEGEDYEEEQQTTTTTTTSTTTARPTSRKSSRRGRPKPKESEQEKKPAVKSKPSQESKKEAAAKEEEASPGETVASNKPNETQASRKHHAKKRPLVLLPFIKPKNTSVCTPEAYLEFPRDLIGDKWRGRGLVIIHVLVVCYMFYSLALVCERYFMPSLEEFAQRLQISEDVAGATLMSAGSSAPELFTAILGVFVAKGDVGTGAIVGSAVFNILFVIGICAFVSSTSAQLQWWPVLRDSIYYTFTVLVLILIIYDERITAFESGLMILLYGLYITIMCYNEQLKAYVTSCLLNYPITAKLISTSSIQIDGPDDVFGGSTSSRNQQYEMGAMKTVEDDSIFMAALLVIIKHKRLFRSTIRFQSAARYIIIKRQHRAQQQLSSAQEVNYFGPDETAIDGPTSKGSAAQRAKMEAYARSTTLSKQKFSIVSKDDYEFWHRPPEEGENYFFWLARIPVNYLLHYTVPDCTLYPDKYIITFVVSIIWTAVFSYLMVWMVTLIGYTLGIPDSVMGVTFLAAGTSVPDCYSSIHAARNGMADMAVSNSIGSNVFDILIGLSVPWFIQSAIYPGIVATINSRGVIYSVILLFLSLVVTIYLLNKYDWSLQPRLGLALLIAYGLFIILTCMLEFNLFGHVNPPPCPPPIGAT